MPHAPQHRHSSLAPEMQGRKEPAHQRSVAAATPTAAVPSAARRRLGRNQLGICLLFFAEGLLGLWVVGWPALSLCILGTLYLARTARRKETAQRRAAGASPDASRNAQAARARRAGRAC